MNPSFIDLQATIFDLQRRVALLEQGLYGHTLPEVDTALLVRCYLEAHRCIRTIDPKAASAWIANAYLWDVRTFLVLGRHVRDPYPFRPFLAVIDQCVLAGVQGAEQAKQHLEAVGQDMLAAQGLELVHPRDTMNTLRLGEALHHLRQP